jgi:hypothetical protein
MHLDRLTHSVVYFSASVFKGLYFIKAQAHFLILTVITSKNVMGNEIVIDNLHRPFMPCGGFSFSFVSVDNMPR